MIKIAWLCGTADRAADAVQAPVPAVGNFMLTERRDQIS
jgi:hypothetical protein